MENRAMSVQKIVEIRAINILNIIFSSLIICLPGCQHINKRIRVFTWYFMAYHTSTYLGRGTGPQRKEPFFPISSWNKYDDVLNDRRLTNNTVEVFNRNWTDSMERTPSLYSVIEGFIRQVNQVNVNNKFLFLFVYLAYQIMIKYLWANTDYFMTWWTII